MSLFDKPYALGPNWHMEAAEPKHLGLRSWLVLREDRRGKIPVGYIHELPAHPRECTRFVATDLLGKTLGPEHKTGPSGAPFDDFKRHKTD